MSSIRVYLINKSNKLAYSDDLCTTITLCGTSTLTPYLSPNDIGAKKTDKNFICAVGSYSTGVNQGIIYSLDGGNTFTQSGGTWLSSASAATFTQICVCPNDENVIYVSSSQSIVAKSTDGGLTFSSVGTASSISGLPPGANTRSVYSTNGIDVVVSISTNVYYSNDGGTSWAIVGGAVDGLEDPFATYVDDGGNLFFAVTKNGVFSSTGGAWSSAFAFPSPLSSNSKAVLSIIGTSTFYTADAANIYLTTDSFGTTNPVYTVVDNVLDIEFYNPTSGLIIDDDPLITVFGARTIDSFTNYIPITDTVSFNGPSKLAIGTDPACGCPPGFIYNTSSELCESTTAVCPDGYTYNADLDLCVGAPVSCKMDLTLVIDSSSSINQTELDNLQAFLVDLVDDINGTNGENRIVNDDVRIGIVRFNNVLEISNAQNILDLSGGPTAWTSSATGGTIKQALSNYNVSFTGATNTLSGLSNGYDNITGVNNRNSDPTVQRRILVITDGFPSWAYGITGTTIPPDNGVYNGITIQNTTLPAGSTNPNYQAYRCQAYKGTMDLAQTIKSGTGGTPVDCDITLMIVGESGNTLEYYKTRDALVGNTGTTSGVTSTTWSTTPCSFNTSPLFGGTSDWSCTYAPSLNRFCSNNIAGDPDYFMSFFEAESLSAIRQSVVESLLCPNTITPLSCNAPCVLNVSTGECECTNIDDYNPCCYDLINCTDGTIYATVNTNSSGFDNIAEYVGSIIVFEGLQECLFVTVTSACNGQTTIDNLNITETFTTCQECQEAIEIDPCYKLTNCNNGDVFLMTNQNLSQVTGLVVELAEYPGLCWTVLKTYNCVGEFTTVSIVQSYPDCECCFQYQCV